MTSGKVLCTKTKCSKYIFFFFAKKNKTFHYSYLSLMVEQIKHLRTPLEAIFLPFEKYFVKITHNRSLCNSVK